MKTYKVSVIFITSVIAAVIAIYSVKKRRLQKKLIRISDAGYETANDILFPLRSQRQKKRG
jgi:hypothetical protein